MFEGQFFPRLISGLNLHYFGGAVTSYSPGLGMRRRLLGCCEQLMSKPALENLGLKEI